MLVAKNSYSRSNNKQPANLRLYQGAPDSGQGLDKASVFPFLWLKGIYHHAGEPQLSPSNSPKSLCWPAASKCCCPSRFWAQISRKTQWLAQWLVAIGEALLQLPGVTVHWGSLCWWQQSQFGDCWAMRRAGRWRQDSRHNWGVSTHFSHPLSSMPLRMVLANHTASNSSFCSIAGEGTGVCIPCHQHYLRAQSSPGVDQCCCKGVASGASALWNESLGE